MKNFIYLILSVILFTACGEDSNVDSETEQTSGLEEYEEIDLTQWGFEMSIMVPNAEGNGDPEITLTERGALEILIGNDFGIEIMFGEGNLALLKADLKEDLVFTAKIVEEEEDALVYIQNIPNTEVKEQNHFFYKKSIGNDIYEVRDLIDGEYGLEMIKKMLAAAKTIKHKTISPVEA